MGTWFLVLCPECPLDEVHGDVARTRRVARDHHHAGTAVIRIAAIWEGRAHQGGRHQLGWIFTGAMPPWFEKKTASAPKSSRLRRVLARRDIA
jgi:hypothetical protein